MQQAGQARAQADASRRLRERTRAPHRRLQLRAAEEICLSDGAAVDRGRDQAPSRRYLAHAVRDEEHGERQGAAPGDPRARRKRERRAAHLAARGIEAVRAGCAAVADDEDPAWPRRNLRPGRATEAAAAAAALAVRNGGRGRGDACRGGARAGSRGASRVPRPLSAPAKPATPRPPARGTRPRRSGRPAGADGPAGDPAARPGAPTPAAPTPAAKGSP